MEIKTEDYSIQCDPATATVSFQGALRPSGADECAPITQMLNAVADEEPPIIALNLRELEFLNSSGIGMLSKFVIKVRQKENVGMVIQGSQAIPWQRKSLKNLQRLMPALKLELEG